MSGVKGKNVQLNTPVIIALGFFDSVHKGHRKVISEAKTQAEKSGAELVVFTFKDNLKENICKREEKQVYTAKERKIILDKLGVKNVFFAPVNKTFLSMGRLSFLRFLDKKYNVVGYVCGEDYRFGKGGKGDVKYLGNYAKNHDKNFTIVKSEDYLGKRISTTQIKKHLSNGEISKANFLLGENYFVLGKVFKDRQVGAKLGFPTINIKIDDKKHLLDFGVYAGEIAIDNAVYKTVINYGARPTFNLGERLIEAHVCGFNGNLYGKEIAITFTKRIRDIVKFSTKEQLINRLNLDVKIALGETDD